VGSRDHAQDGAKLVDWEDVDAEAARLVRE
jgi:hypothetical protein